jgi:hypothetical protein
MAASQTQLIALRDHLRLTWRATVAAFYQVEDTLGPQRQYLLRVNPTFHSVAAAAYVYLVSSRSFVRTADKAAQAMGSPTLQEFNKNLDKEFSGHKNARDILEHFEDYALGEGKMQKAGKMFAGTALTVERDSSGETNICVFHLEPLPLSKFAWWIDALNSHTERNLHDAIEPGTEWKGIWPQFNYEAPPDWRTR